MNELVKTLLLKEKTINTKIDFDNHPQINSKMFTVLLNWLCQVNDKFKHTYETLCLTHQVISRYLASTADCEKSKLQLLGASAYYLCSKYEEDDSPEITDIVYICANTYSRSEIIEMEFEIMCKFDFNLLYVPTLHIFLQHFIIPCSSYTREVNLCIMYLCETSLINTIFLEYPMSKIVASIIVIGHNFTGLTHSHTTIDHTGYKLEQLSDCIETFNNFFNDKLNYCDEDNNYVYKKFSKVKYGSIATIFEQYIFSK